MFDIETLRVIWWLLLGVLLMGFAITDGFDFGAAILLPFIARTEIEKRLVLYSIGPFWEGNQVWIILGAGAVFAAWPFVYAVAFSGFYLLILLLLLTMGISRPVSFKYRDKLTNPTWRRFWDRMVFIGGLVPAFIFGMLMGNVLLGVPFELDETLRMFYSGTFFDLFHPFALFCGLTSVVMLVMHGGLFIAIKNTGVIEQRASRAAQWMSALLICLFALGGVWVMKAIPGYLLQSGADPMDYSNPLHKTVTSAAGAWMMNYHLYPSTMIAPILGMLGALGVLVMARRGNHRIAFLASALSIIGVISTVGVSTFPFILPSSSNMTSSLLVWDSSSSTLTLLLMLVATLIFIPLIVLYTSWVYRVLGGKVDSSMIVEHEKASS